MKGGLVIYPVTRIVGHAELRVTFSGGVPRAEFRVLNDPRFFERIVLGKDFRQVPWIVSRICGPCSLSHTLCSIFALEAAIGVEVPEHVLMAREAAAELEVAENHLVHLALLAAPDYLGLRGPLELARERPEFVKRVLRLRSALAEAAEGLVGRLTHPSACVIGGFTKEPLPERLEKAARKLARLIPEAEAVARLAMELSYPSLNVSGERLLAVAGGDGYSFTGSSLLLEGHGILKPLEYTHVLREEAVRHSTCSRVTALGDPIYVGARARLNARGVEHLADTARGLASNLKLPLRNPFDNLKAKAIEMVHCVERASHILSVLADEARQRGLKLRTGVEARAGEGVGVKEAPRGVLIHHYVVGEGGLVEHANIITPTTINSYHLEKASEALASARWGASSLRDELARLVRAYDPCLGCATHAVRITVEVV
ncbi:MAG: hypothetical protein DRJ67_00730 [Thermoprotei archaeon]|nr:MAG: hypothetical protein DRJ67_00730 [Thermoprotei archaeon]